MKKTTMLEHQIKVLENVRNNDELFRKEISKSRNWLSPEEFEKLKQWLDIFSKTFRDRSYL